MLHDTALMLFKALRNRLHSNYTSCSCTKEEQPADTDLRTIIRHLDEWLPVSEIEGLRLFEKDLRDLVDGVVVNSYSHVCEMQDHATAAEIDDGVRIKCERSSRAVVDAAEGRRWSASFRWELPRSHSTPLHWS
jgi:hypothetical protein